VNSTDQTNARWEAISRRDAAADGSFVYGVVTTGVYCLPSCGSRAARRENVRFYADNDTAEAAGFRACKRCRPDGASLAVRQTEQVVALCRYIEGLDQPPTLQALASHAGLSPSHLSRIFKKVTGVTPKGYCKLHQSKRVCAALRAADSVTDAIYSAGYSSSSRFYENADAIIGMTPTEFRAGGTALPIRFAVGECSLGSVLVAATERGICTVTLGDDPEVLVRDLERRFFEAELIGSDARFMSLVARVVGLIESPQTGLDLPLDIRGTTFQLKVWTALRKVPAGSTLNYRELAIAIGRPTAARAVAAACAANPVAVAIPCHRVIRKDGGLAGYRWGIERKRTLLAREAQAPPTADK